MACNTKNQKTMTNYETKTFVYNEDGPGAYTIMVTKFDGEINDGLESVGYRNSNMLFMVLDSTGVSEGTHDPRALANKITGRNDDTLKYLLVELKRNGKKFEELEDGMEFTKWKANEWASRVEQ